MLQRAISVYNLIFRHVEPKQVHDVMKIECFYFHEQELGRGIENWVSFKERIGFSLISGLRKAYAAYLNLYIVFSIWAMPVIWLVASIKKHPKVL